MFCVWSNAWVLKPTARCISWKPFNQCICLGQCCVFVSTLKFSRNWWIYPEGLFLSHCLIWCFLCRCLVHEHRTQKVLTHHTVRAMSFSLDAFMISVRVHFILFFCRSQSVGASERVMGNCGGSSVEETAWKCSSSGCAVKETQSLLSLPVQKPCEYYSVIFLTIYIK